MKKFMMSTCVCAALALTACGGDSDRLDSVQDVPPAPSGPVHTEDGQRFELRLRGASVEGYDKLELPIGAVRVTTADGAPLKVELTQERVDVAGADHAPLVAYFYVPEGVEQVRVTFQTEGLGGYSQGEGSGYVDASVAPVTFEAPVHELSLRGRAVVQLDMARSLVDLGSHRLLLPNGIVNY